MSRKSTTPTVSKAVPNIVPEKIQLQKVSVFKANLETSYDFLNAPVGVEDFEIAISPEQAHNLNEDRVRIRLFIALDGKDRSGSKVGLKAEYGIEFHYRVEDMKGFFRVRTDEKVEQDLTFASTLVSISISTARGIILERTQGTPLNGVILPIMDVPKILIKKD